MEGDEGALRFPELVEDGREAVGRLAVGGGLRCPGGLSRSSPGWRWAGVRCGLPGRGGEVAFFAFAVFGVWSLVATVVFLLIFRRSGGWLIRFEHESRYAEPDESVRGFSEQTMAPFSVDEAELAACRAGSGCPGPDCPITT